MNIRKSIRLSHSGRRRHVDFALLVYGLLLAMLPAMSQAGAGPALTETNDQFSEPDNTSQLFETTRHRASVLLSRQELSVYRGWIKYLRFRAEREISRASVTNRMSCTNVVRFAGWVRRIEANPNVLGTLRGVQEWAYDSPVDDSGQPFTLNIPTDYKPGRPPGLLVNLHYAMGDHHQWMAPHKGMFELAVLGRARAGGYEGLAEADVLQAIDYVETCWHIDTNRIHLTGLSMGGAGVPILGADFPQLFASGEIDAGFVGIRPVNNLLTFPVYAIHSQDDPLAPIVTSRGPLARLRELGGTVVFDQTNGFGHDVWKYDAGHQRAASWRQHQVRPNSRAVRRLDFTALSGTAARAWWAEVVEWGPAPQPAHFALTAGKDNSLRANLSNITRLRLRIGESPFDRKQSLRVFVDGSVPFEVHAPLPESLVLVSGSDGWQAETKTELPPCRLHTPGGPMLLYDGSPLLIVYGTHGDTDVCKALRAAAGAADKSPSPVWSYDTSPVDGEGVPYRQNLYGWLKTKADRDVTDTDLQKCHLVLIGTAEQNTVVARLAPQLPIRRTAGKILCSDGFELDGANRVTALVHYNPLAPQRLIFWVAGDGTNGYATPSHFIFGPADFVVTDSGQGTLVVARSFDNRWRWDPARAASPLMPTNAVTEREAGLDCAKALQQATHADFVFKVASTNTAPRLVPGITRLADVLPYFYYDPVCLVDLTGTELLEFESRRQAPPREEFPKRLLRPPDLIKIVHPAIDPARIEPKRTYRMAMFLREGAVFGQTSKLAPPSFRMTDLEAADVLDRFFPAQRAAPDKHELH